MPSLYPNIFLEHLLNKLVFPFKPDLTLPAMQLFGGYDLTFGTAYALAGGIAASFLGWAMGRMLWLILEKGNLLVTTPATTKTVRWAQQRGFFLLPLFAFPLGSFLPFAAGFLKLSGARTCGFAGAGYALYLLYYLTRGA